MSFSASSSSSWQEASCCRRKGRLLTWTFAREGCCAKRIDHYFNFLLESLIVPAISLWEFMLRGSPQGGLRLLCSWQGDSRPFPPGIFHNGMLHQFTRSGSGVIKCTCEWADFTLTHACHQYRCRGFAALGPWISACWKRSTWRLEAAVSLQHLHSFDSLVAPSASTSSHW